MKKRNLWLWMAGVVLSVLLLGALSAKGQSSEGWIEEMMIPRCVAIVTESGLGTGVFASPDGYIVTCKHVVSGADTIIVYTLDFRKFSGRVVGTHSEYDIAVLKIEPTEEMMCFDLEEGTEESVLSPRKVHLGEDVYAIGMPFGLPWTVSKGIVSQRFRIVDGAVYWQTDTAINPGNSGGPLLNENGQLIGINSIGFPAWGAENIAFAVASQVWIEEMGLLIQMDRLRMEPIEDVNEYFKQQHYNGR